MINYCNVTDLRGCDVGHSTIFWENRIELHGGVQQYGLFPYHMVFGCSLIYFDELKVARTKLVGLSRIKITAHRCEQETNQNRQIKFDDHSPSTKDSG